MAEKLVDYLEARANQRFIVLTKKELRKCKLKKYFLDKDFISLFLKRLKRKKRIRKAKLKYVIRMMDNYRSIYQLYRKHKNKEKEYIFIIDEGILTSAEFMFNLKTPINENELAKLMNKIKEIKSIGYNQQKIVYISVNCRSYEETMRRVRNRDQSSGYLRLNY